MNSLVSNKIDGSDHPENVVQSRDVQGGIHFHGTSKALPVPRQLPAVSRFFTGRSDDLEMLDSLLRENTTTPHAVIISTIAGIAGVGKTALAVYWAHRMRDRFPDGELYVNLRGYDPGLPVAAEEAVGRFLRALDVPPGKIPTDLEEQTALYRSLLNGRRMLIVLDNAENSAQVRPLLPAAPGCLVLITSRSRLSSLSAHDGAVRVTLKPLKAEESFELLKQVIGEGRVDAEPDAARHLAERCGHLPLALRIAAEWVAARPHARLADFVENLAMDPGRLDVLAVEGDETTAVAAAFSWSYRALPAGAARVFRLLGVHPGADIDLAAVAAVANISIREAAQTMDLLVSSHLAEQTAPVRYQLHDLLRAYAIERVMAEDSPEVREEATHRLLKWYTHASSEAAVRVDMNPRIPVTSEGLPVHAEFGDRDEACRWLEVEFANLACVVRLAVDAGFDSLAWRLSESLHGYVVLSKRLLDGLAISEAGIDAARRSRERPGEALTLNMHAHVLSDLGRYAEALDSMQKALEVWRAEDDRRGQARALNNIGFCYRELGRYDEAVAYLEESLGLARLERDRLHEGFAMTNLGETCRRLGRLDDALAKLQVGVALRREVGDLWGEGFALNNLADTYLDLNRFDDAVEVLGDALAVRRRIGDRWGEAQTLHSLGIAMRETGDLDAAQEFLRRAVEIFQDLNDVRAHDVRSCLDDVVGRLASSGA
ncbi:MULTISPECIES: ATP-binding protein [unclassified Saccharothrix]|uniref:ATP-binding protein n=1 Tax=unclassified Saccharothrix TaxID=2593673 RepID=UPI00307D9376